MSYRLVARRAASFGVAIVVALTCAQSARGQAVRWTADPVALEESVGSALWRWVAAQPCASIPWRASTRDRSAVLASAEPVRRYVRNLARTVPGSVTPAVGSREVLYEDLVVRVELVTLTSRFAGASVAAYLAIPKNRSPSPARGAVIVHGTFARPEEAFGWRSPDASAITLSGTGLEGVGTALVRRGFIVLVPFVSEDYQFGHRLPWLDVENLGAALAAGSSRGNALSLVSGQLSTAVDFVHGATSAPVAIVGWEEGAFLGAVTAINDDRIGAVVRLSPPRDTRVMRMTEAGVRAGAPIAQLDCVIPEVAQAAALLPRPTLYAWSATDPTATRNQRFVSQAVADSIRALSVAVGVPFAARQFDRHDGELGNYVATWLAQALSFSAPGVALGSIARPRDMRYPVSTLAQSQLELSQMVAQQGTCVPIDAHVDLTDRGVAAISADRYRDIVRRTLGVSNSRRGVPRVVVRDTIPGERPYRLEWVWVETADGAHQLGGLLATPTEVRRSRVPAVLSFDGNYGVGQVFGLPPGGRTEYLGAYGDFLARNGVVVFVPARPSWEPRGLTALLRWRGAAQTRVAWVLDYFAFALDFVLAQPLVDPDDIVAYGISEAAYPALYLTALDRRVTGLVYSNPFVAHDVYFLEPTNVGSGVWQYEMCSTVDAVMRYLIAPRMFTWEGDNSDLSRYPVDPLDAPLRIAATYRAIGASGQFRYRRHIGDHVTKIQELFRDMPFKRRAY